MACSSLVSRPICQDCPTALSQDIWSYCPQHFDVETPMFRHASNDGLSCQARDRGLVILPLTFLNE